MNKISVPWQTAAALSILTGMIAFRRINKFRRGGLIYIFSYALVWGSISLSLSLDLYNLHWVLSIGLIGLLLGALVATFVMPLWYMEKWTREYNQNLISG